jgi:hypothetical protein
MEIDQSGGTRFMKKMMVIVSLLFGVVGITVPAHSAQQESSQEIKQRVTKKTNIVTAGVGVRYQGPPRFVSIQETSISYATNTPQEVINIGNKFYLYTQDVWLESANAQGPWKAAQYVPKAVAAIVCSQLNIYALDPYQLCALPWSSGLSYTVWKPS